MTALIQLEPRKRTVEVQIDGRKVQALEGTTILDACTQLDQHIPTLCYLDTLRPVNACRVCVVELEGSRVLVPACSRPVAAGMVIKTNSERVRLSRKLVLEFLASSVDLSTTPDVADWLTDYGAKPERFGPPAPPANDGARDAAVAGHHAPPDPRYAATGAQPPN